MIVWFVARHVLYMKIVLSIFKHVPGDVKYGCYKGGGQDVVGPFKVSDERAHLLEPFWNPTGTICFNDRYKWGFVYTLMALQSLLLLWFGMIIRVAIKVLKGGGADDSRSDDEEDEEEVLDQVQAREGTINSAQPYDDEVDVEDVALRKQRSSPARRYRKSGGMSSGMTLPSDRKELLGRVGCHGSHD